MRSPALAWLCLAAALTGCASFSPGPLDDVPFRERLLVQERDGLRVAVAVPDRDETRQLFGADLYGEDMQPVWVEIHNGTGMPLSLLRSALDAMYFSAGEAAYASHRRFRPATNLEIDRHFASLGIGTTIEPGERDAGFVIANKDEGTKHVLVGLVGPGRTFVFEFDVPVPGLKLDWEAVDWENLYTEEQFHEITSEEAFRQLLRGLPCCTTRSDGGGAGDPLNLIFVGEPEIIGSALNRSGWDETERLTFSTAWRTFRSGVFGGEYRYSPMSSLYAFERPQDAGFQKARQSIHQRNHLRLWLAPVTFQGRPVWLGTITRDIGVYFTPRAWNLTTHAIDPDVDEARRYVLEDLVLSQFVSHVGYVEGVGAATPEDPHRNLMFAPWWTDGHRAVLFFDAEPTALEDLVTLRWDWPDTEDDDAINRELEALYGGG